MTHRIRVTFTVLYSSSYNYYVIIMSTSMLQSSVEFNFCDGHYFKKFKFVQLLKFFHSFFLPKWRMKTLRVLLASR